MIIKIECTQEERQAIKAMAQKTAVMRTIEAARKMITPKGENAVEIKPSLMIATARLIEYAAPLLVGVINMFKTSMEAIHPYIDAVKKAAEEEG